MSIPGTIIFDIYLLLAFFMSLNEVVCVNDDSGEVVAV